MKRILPSGRFRINATKTTPGQTRNQRLRAIRPDAFAAFFPAPDTVRAAALDFPRTIPPELRVVTADLGLDLMVINPAGRAPERIAD